jgi:DNA invertase Pin-like site-specific DNA recombinase
MKRVAGYLRVSTDQQADSGLGLAAQRARITSEAKHRGWEVVWFVDDGYSAKDLNRPALTDALAALAAHDLDGLVVAKLDRLSRSVVDFSNTLNRAKKQKWAVVLLDLGVDTSTPNGKLVAGLMAQIAEWEREVIGQRTREALAAAKARGQRLGRPRATPDHVVARVVDLRASGLTASAIARALTDEGIPTTRGAVAWGPSSVRRLLKGHQLDQLSAEALASREQEAS